MLIRKAARTIRKYSMFSRGDKVLVCVSGGPDSVCLLEILRLLSGEFGIRLSVCHADHMLRKDESRADAEFTGRLARENNLPFYSCRKNVRLHAERKGFSIEEAGRKIRYEFFQKTAEKHGINKIALGHNLDDQAETVLLNLIRGSGLEGLSGIPPARELGKTGIYAVRPLIESSRAEIENFLLKNKIAFRDDPSNRKNVYLRNRLRLELLPFIESNFDPRIRHRLAKTAGIFREYRDYLYLNTAETIKKSIKTTGPAAEISIGVLKGLHPAVKRLLLQEAFKAAGNSEASLSSAHVEQINVIAESRLPNRKLSLPGGMTAVREYDRLIFKKARGAARAPAAALVMRVPGKNRVPGPGIAIEFSVAEAGAPPGSGEFAGIDLEKIRFPVAVRRRKDGDRFSPPGMTGTRKLKDFLIDKKIPMDERDRMLVFVDADDRILCMMSPSGRSIAIDRESMATDKTKRVMQVRIV